MRAVGPTTTGSQVDMSTPQSAADGRPRGSSVELSLAPPRAAVDEDEPDSGNGLGPMGRPKRRVPEPPLIANHDPARIMAICNQKGGVGKTTSTINLGAALAEYGRRVLLVDFDPQGALSVGLGVNPLELDPTIYNLLLERNIPVETVIRPT